MNKGEKGIDHQEALRLLPVVGARMRKIPTILGYGSTEERRPIWCEVVYVNRDHLWYRVRFHGGTYECYKVPEIWKEHA